MTSNFGCFASSLNAPLLRNSEPTDPNQPEPSQIENAKQKVRLNSNQKAIQPLASICWNSISAHLVILIHSLKS